MNQPNPNSDISKYLGQHYDHITDRPDWSQFILDLRDNIGLWKNCIGVGSTHFSDDEYKDRIFFHPGDNIENMVNGSKYNKILSKLTRKEFDMYFELAKQEKPEGHDVYLVRDLGCYLHLMEQSPSRKVDSDQDKRAMLFIRGPWKKERMIENLMIVNDILDVTKREYEVKLSHGYDSSFAYHQVPYTDITEEDQAKLEIWEFILDSKNEDDLNHNERNVFAAIKAELFIRSQEAKKLRKQRWYEIN